MASSSLVLAAQCWIVFCSGGNVSARHPVAKWLGTSSVFCLLTAEEDVLCFFRLTLYRNSLEIMFPVSNFEQTLLTFEKSQIRPNEAHIQQVSWWRSVLEGLMAVIKARTTAVIKGWKSSQLNQKSSCDEAWWKSFSLHKRKEQASRQNLHTRCVFVCWWEQIHSFRRHLRCEAVMKGPDGRTGPTDALLTLSCCSVVCRVITHLMETLNFSFLLPIFQETSFIYTSLFVCNESAAL